MKAFQDRPENKILQKLEASGFEAYFVGGCVRDACLRELYQTALPVGDIDITTDARPEQIKALFADWDVIETGIRHGTVTLLMPQADAGRIPVEVTTYRIDGTYSDNRHPDRIQFTASLTEDLQRRDFTINAMACDIRGTLRDPFGGRQDLQTRTLRAVGTPQKRFQEDALRIMRGVRFAAVLGFTVEPQTQQAMLQERAQLSQISAERIYLELRKLIAGKFAGHAIRSSIDILAPVFPELAAMKGFLQNNPYHKYDVLEHCIRAMEVVQTTPENQIYMKLSALLHDVGKPLVYTEDEQGIGHFYGHPAKSRALTESILTRLKADRFTIDRVSTLVHYHDLIFERDPRLLKRWMHRLGADVMQELLEIKLADNIATGNIHPQLQEKFEEIRQILQEILLEEQCFSLKDLALHGQDLIQAGIPPGPKMGHLLNYLLAEVIEERLPNERTTLLNAARKMFEQQR